MRRALALGLLIVTIGSPNIAPAEARAFSFSGRTETEVCLGVGPNETCAVLTEPEGTPWPLPAAERYDAIEFTVTFQSLPGSVADLFVVLQRLSEGTWQSQWANGHVALSGTSPLNASWDLSSYPDGAALRLAVFAGSDRAAGGAVFLYTGLARDFAVQGTLVAS